MKQRELRKLIVLTVSVFLAASQLIKGTRTISAEEDWTDTTVTYAAVNPYYGGWSNCTWSAWQLCYDYTGVALPRLGNAGAWYGNAAAYGYSVGTSPAAMSVGVWSNHVVFVTQVSEDGSMVYIKEGGFNGHYMERWVSAWGTGTKSLIGYIYL